ncbi:MAG: hypothetical protein ONB44_12780 [candidate division KSB1 bacterium]|nr:hypothetical protein [candidate division KSB1 bacterium]MDZ7312270.1 hypothetical protein [candidate division KSB1 bacterium]
MKIYDEVVVKAGDLLIDLGKTATIAGFASFFVKNFNLLLSIGTVLVGLILIFTGLYLFHVKSRRREDADKTTQKR